MYKQNAPYPPRVSRSRNVFVRFSRTAISCRHVKHSFINRTYDQIAHGAQSLSLTTAGLLVTLNGKVTRLITVYIIRRNDYYHVRKNVDTLAIFPRCKQKEKKNLIKWRAHYCKRTTVTTVTACFRLHRHSLKTCNFIATMRRSEGNNSVCGVSQSYCITAQPRSFCERIIWLGLLPGENLICADCFQIICKKLQ